MSDWLQTYLSTFSERKAAEDYSIWSRPLDAHSYGEFSIAAVKTGLIMEDNSQVEAGQNATVVGVYDGHGHPLASDYVSEKLFHHLLEAANENDAITEGVLKHAFQKTEEGFIDIVKKFPEYTAIGSCCLVGVIWKGKLYVANLGDSGAVLGYLDSDNMIRSKGLTQSHHISEERIRNELLADHPDDPELLIQNVESDYKIKGVIEVSRTIGDAYLKVPGVPCHKLIPKFAVPIQKAILKSEPSVTDREIEATDKFIIFASAGLWKYISKPRAVEIVHTNPRNDIAKTLVEAALTVAATKKGMEYSDLKKMDQKERLKFHDDITVVVMFLDYARLKEIATMPGLSIQGFRNHSPVPSTFNVFKPSEFKGFDPTSI